MPTDTLGAHLRMIRTRTDLMLTDVAAEVGVTRPTVSRWEAGLRSMTIAQLRGYLDAVSATPEDRSTAWELAGVPGADLGTDGEAA